VIDGKLCHSLIGGSTVKCSKQEACMELKGWVQIVKTIDKSALHDSADHDLHDSAEHALLGLSLHNTTNHTIQEPTVQNTIPRIAQWRLIGPNHIHAPLWIPHITGCQQNLSNGYHRISTASSQTAT
jgi:hypothetical protein